MPKHSQIIKFNDIIGQNKAIKFLKLILAKNKLHRSMIFTGIPSIGKHTTATAFAAACNCKSTSYDEIERKSTILNNLDACGKCISCKLIITKNHPDISYVGLEKNEITISDIKSILSWSKLKPYIAKYKITIISEAQNMNDKAISMFLKFLEEPYKRNITILTASSKMNLAPTIVSRCHCVQFSPLSLKDANKIISKNKTSKVNISEVSVNLSLGSVVKIEKFNDKYWNTKRKWVVSTLKTLYLNQKKIIDLQLWFLFSEMLYLQKNIVDKYLLIIKFYLRDILVYTFAPVKVINTDMLEEISIISNSLSYAYILNQVKIIQQTQKNLNKKNNLKLTLDEMVINMARADIYQ